MSFSLLEKHYKNMHKKHKLKMFLIAAFFAIIHAKNI